jgi:nitrogen regulation protein NR(I)
MTEDRIKMPTLPGSMPAASRILLIEDDLALAESLKQVLVEEEHIVTHEVRGDRGLANARERDFDVVVTDMKLPGLSGLELVRELHTFKPRLPMILMTAHGTTETAIEATKLGAYDYLVKPFEMEELLAVLNKAIASSRLMSEPVEMGAPAMGRLAIVGSSRSMQTIYKEIGRVAAKPITVLIRGETGTGKELVARAIYQHGDRAHAPFIAINCSAIPENLLESELFGHERGAFTGAEARRIGRFEQANGGTIFLDEIGDMPLNTQVKLLRVLQERSFQRVGGQQTIPADVRVIAATHRDLESAMQQKQFREDLYYRLSVVVIRLPPLHERPEDIPDLASYFLRKYGQELGNSKPAIHPDALQLLQCYSWPGNVRELENTVRKALLAARGYTISPETVREAMSRPPELQRSTEASLRQMVGDWLDAAERGELTDVHARLLEIAERELLSQAIQRAQGNQAKAARWLGLSRLTVREKLTRFGLRPNHDESTQ